MRAISLPPIMMDVRDLLRLLRADASRPVLDFVVADPPCTPWSRAGKRKGLEDERDMLTETIELLDLLRPRAWLIGNVPGLDDSNNWRTVVQPVIGGFATRSDYCVDYTQLDAADYGVPQHRVRPFWFGHPKGTPCIRWPELTHDRASQPTLPGIPALSAWVTCGEALTERFGPDPSQWGRHVRLRKRGNKKGNGKRPRASSPDAPAGVVTTRENQGDGTVIVYDWRHPPSMINAPGHHDPTVSNASGSGILLSPEARACLQDFPPGWHFAGKTKKARDSQIGQAMPPGFAEAVARSIVRWFETSATPPCPSAPK